MTPKPANVLDFESARAALKVKHLGVKKSFSEKYPSAQSFLTAKGLDLGKLRAHSAKILGTGAISGALLSSPVLPNSLPAPTAVVRKVDTISPSFSAPIPLKKQLIDSLSDVLPDKPRPLIREEEEKVEEIVDSITKVAGVTTLEGEHLNTVYGYIGAEQHLPRFPGDTASQHSDSHDIVALGITPGKGAWGYFAPSQAKLTPDLEDKEKWYAVVQTLYLPEWNKRVRYLREWYKYRKVLIINTVNGNAVVAAIADSGPAAWTGKHFGGSPEVMFSLGGKRYKKGAVLVLFVDDPDNKIPLGPINYNNESLPGEILVKS